IHLSRQHHPDTKSGQEDHTGISDRLDCTVNLTIAMNRPLHIDIQKLPDCISGDGQMGADGNLFTADKDFGVISSRDRTVITAVLPFDPDLTVVVSRSTPYIILHRLTEQGRLIEYHFPESTGCLVIDIAEVAAAQ